MSSTGHMTPRSLLAHRPIGADMPDIVPWVKRASRTQTTPRVPPNRVSSRQQAHLSWEMVVGLSMVVTLLLIVFSHTFVDWTTTIYNTAVYGTPRTFQINAAVGHEGASEQFSHFIALNNEGHIEVIEFPGNDAAHARVYFGPVLTGPHADQVPVTLTFPASGQTNTPNTNMLVQVQGMSLLFLNEHGTFVPASTEGASPPRSSVTRGSEPRPLAFFEMVHNMV